MFLFYLFSLAKCDEFSNDVVETENVTIKPMNASVYFNDPPAKTSFGYISAYTEDDEEGHYFLLALTCGYSLYRASPHFDRILMIPKEMEISEYRLTKLSKAWTHIIRRPLMQLPNKYNDKALKKAFFWFKLNAWSCTGWKKLLWTGIDTVYRRDPSKIFDYPTPCSVIDHFVYGFSHLGPVTSGEFFLFRPCLRDYAGLRMLAVKWCRHPNEYGFKIQQQGAPWTGPLDHGLITQYFDGNVAIAPQYFQLEVPGNPKSFLGYNNTENPDPKVVSFHYSSLFLPWKKNIGSYTYVWSNILHAACEQLDINLDFKKLGIPEKRNIHQSLDFAMEIPRTAEPAEELDNNDGYDVKLLFPETQYIRRGNARIASFIIFSVLSLLAFILKFYSDIDSYIIVREE